jgi:hypothetical protein
MYRAATTIALVLVPSLLLAQASVKAGASSSTQAQVGRGANASTNASVDAEVALAKERGLPTQPIRRRAAEGRAKGASEAQVALAARRVRMNLESAHEAMVRAGREKPSDQETERAATAVERGYTRAQIEAVVKSAPSDRSLVVAFDVLTRLVARGVATENALAQVRSRLEARATDAQLNALASANAGANAGLGLGRAAGNASAGAGAGAAAGVAGGAAGVAGGVTGTVGGVIKKP